MFDADDEDGIRALEAIVRDDHARRELLWLRAMETGDRGTARDLEEVDRDLVPRLAAAGCDFADRIGETPFDRRERFARLWEERFEFHLDRQRAPTG